ncbi:MAG TPA: MFS transporter [Jatrophihabitans sp.]|nr:MFS transporter [Jatrophihabitans sp.]
MNLPATLVRPVADRVDRVVGGPARRHVILVLALVLALDSADKATVGTSATQLEAALHIGKAQIGLLLAVSSGVGALATIPAGMFVDRVCRTRMLSWAVAGWGVAMLLSGFSTNYVFLLLTRVALGAVVAVAGPAIASLIGDYFPERERGRIYGFVLAGELVGAGFGFVVAGQFATMSWRAPFFVLVAPTLLVWWLLVRLPEPERGGASRMQSGLTDLQEAAEGGAGEGEDAPGEPAEMDDDDEQDLAQRVVRQGDVEPREEAVLEGTVSDMSMWQAFRHVVTVRTNVVLIVASALGYFFFSGLRGFAIQFAKKHYDLSQSGASALTLVIGIGALLGVLVGGRLADRLLRNGHISARVQVPGVTVLCAAVIFVPALLTTSVWVAIPLLVLASLFLGATNPPLDAARLDVMLPCLWGRAEAVRTVLRNAGDAVAPLLFGILASSVFGGSTGLEYTFLVMLVTLFAGALITLLIGRRTYPQDVAAAAESANQCD